jgi:hypothetical protein
MKTYLNIILELDNELSGIKDVSENVTDQMDYTIGTRVHRGIIQIHQNR